MAKPERIRHTGVACLINGYPSHRVQTVAISSDITRDETQELANANIVEYISQAPKVSLSIDSNEVGSTNLMAAITGKFVPLTATTGADWRSGTYLQNMTSTANNAWSITESDLIGAYADVALTVTEDATTVGRTCWVHRAALSGVTLSYDQGGLASENYTLEADNKTWFLNNYRDARMYMVRNNQVRAYSSAANYEYTFCLLSSALYQVASAGLKTSTTIAVGIGPNVYRLSASDYTIMNGGLYTATIATTSKSSRGKAMVKVQSANQWMNTGWNPDSLNCMVMIVPFTAQTWSAGNTTTNPGFKNTAVTTAIGGISRGQIDIYLSTGSSTSLATNKLLRAQTANIDIGMTTDANYELGRDGAYGYLRQSPIPVSVTLTFNDSDLETWAKITGTTFASVADIYLSLFKGNNKLFIKVYKDKAKATLLKTVTVNNMSVVSERHNVAVGSVATQEFGFTASNITVAGSGYDTQ